MTGDIQGQTFGLLDGILDELERVNSRIRYYRFTKAANGYIFKTFVDYKDGHTNQYQGVGVNRVDAVRKCIENIRNDIPMLSNLRRHK